jgi:hypothetical protein
MTFSGPLAIIKVNGQAIGKMKSINYNENVNRGRVGGLGTLNPMEVPALSWDGTLSCDSYLIDFKATMFLNSDVGKAFYRGVQTIDDFINTVLLQEQGIQVDVLRKKALSQDAKGIITPTYEIFASITGVFMTREGMQIGENQLGGRNAEFTVINPVIFPG